jgi:hypothetical protein
MMNLRRQRQQTDERLLPLLHLRFLMQQVGAGRSSDARRRTYVNFIIVNLR